MRVLTLVLAMALTAGCASQPAAPTAPGAAAVATAAKPAAPAAADATAAAKVPSGYRAKVRNGETVYCKNVARIGSNFTTETCMSAAEAEEQARRAEFDRQQFRQNQAVCGTGGCGGS
jgi:hypothetical protein